MAQQKTKKVAVFASGTGSNYTALMKGIHEREDVPGEVALLVCDRPGAPVLAKAAADRVPSFAVDPKTFDSKQHYEQSVLEQLQHYDVDYIVLAGYMRLLGKTLLRPYQGKILNIHPSLLPAFPGLDAIGQALEYGVRITGITIHFVDEGMDTGPVIFQKCVDIRAGETRDSLTKRIQEVEHTYYPQIVNDCLLGKIECQEGRVQWPTLNER